MAIMKTPRRFLPRIATCEELETRQLLTAVPDLIANIYESGKDSNPGAFFAMNDRLYFSHQGRSKENVEPLFYDGNAARLLTGTERDDDDALIATQFIDLNGTLYFAALDNDDDDSQIWRFDGNDYHAAHELCFDIDDDFECEVQHEDPRDLVLFDGAIYFSAHYSAPPDPQFPNTRWAHHGRKLLRLDEDGLTPAVDIRLNETPDRHGNFDGSDPRDLTIYRGELFFSAFTDEVGRELWRFDGENASLVADIVIGEEGSEPTELFVYDDRLYFSAFDAEHGRELWSFDGQVTTVHEIVAGETGGEPRDLAGFRGELYFSAESVRQDRELWKLLNEGTTVEVADIQTEGSSYPKDFVEFDGKLFLTAAEFGEERELWSYDGTSVRLSDDIWPGPIGSDPKHMTVFGDELVFSADGGNDGSELWRFDGQTSSQIADLQPDPNSSFPQFLTKHDGHVYFGANSRQGAGLWRYDGSTVELVETTSNDSGVFGVPGFMASIPNGLLMRMHIEGFGNEPAFYDGEQIHLIKDIYPGRNGSVGSSSNESIAFQGKAYFGAVDDQDRGRLWEFDGVEAKPVNAVRSSEWPPQNFVATDEALYFIQYVSATAASVYRYDGDRSTNLGTFRNAGDLAIFNGDLYLSTFPSASIGVASLYRFDGEKMRLVRNMGTASPRGMAAIENRLVIALGGKLWSTDGTNFFDITPAAGFNSSRLAGFTQHQGELYFIAIRNPSVSFGGTLWKTNGERAVEVFPHLAGGGPEVSLRHAGMVSYGGELLFGAKHPVHGNELWRLVDANPGDANLDGVFNSADLVAVFKIGKYESGESAIWQEGDWNSDQFFDSNDLVLAFQAGHYVPASQAGKAEMAAAAEWIFAMVDEGTRSQSVT